MVAYKTWRPCEVKLAFSADLTQGSQRVYYPNAMESRVAPDTYFAGYPANILTGYPVSGLIVI